jgi:arabinogalactan oligomer/maltooligosaccharide transport system permease protein
MFAMAVTYEAAPAAGPSTPPPVGTVGHGRQNIAFAYLAPIIISAIIFTIIPFFYTLYISFTNYHLIYHFSEFNWIGWDNYERVFVTGNEFVPVLRWTVIWMVATTVLNVGGGLALAMMLNHSRLRERNLYRTLLILPWALPNILLIQVWAGIYNSQGPLNLVLGNLGIERIRWLTEDTPARSALLMTNLWLSYPFFMTVGLAALQAIPRDLYEVADLDGAGAWARFRDITVPFLVSAVVPLLLTQLAFQFNNAGIVVLLTDGLPQASPGSAYGVTDTLASFAYELVYTERDMGYAAAYSTIIFLFIAVFIVLSSTLTKSFKESD